MVSRTTVKFDKKARGCIFNQRKINDKLNISDVVNISIHYATRYAPHLFKKANEKLKAKEEKAKEKARKRRKEKRKREGSA